MDPIHKSSDKKRKREKKNLDSVNLVKKRKVSKEKESVDVVDKIVSASVADEEVVSVPQVNEVAFSVPQVNEEAISVPQADEEAASVPQADEETDSDPQANESNFSNTRFDQCSFSQLTLKGFKAAGYERMTIVQELIMPLILKGKDVLAKARRGTGKTAAFLLPAIEVVSKLPHDDSPQECSPIYILVLCSSRKLARQVGAEAITLTEFHSFIAVLVTTGGTSVKIDSTRVQNGPCQILVTTPGRLTNLMKQTPELATQLKSVKVLILDDADKSLQMGWKNNIEEIIAAVPPKHQTLIFSATVPDEVRQISKVALSSDHEFIDTVDETHTHVSQMYTIAPLADQYPVLYSILTAHFSEDMDSKVIIFCTTARTTKLVASLLSQLQMNVRQIHSKMKQGAKTRVFEEFRDSKGLILVSSDVSAGGVYCPDVTLVVQVGVPSSREQYIHRLRPRRTGRKGKGILMLAPQEKYFLPKIMDLPLSEIPIRPVDLNIKKQVDEALRKIDIALKEKAYEAWLGYYKSDKVIGGNRVKVVEFANEYWRSMGLETPPAISRKEFLLLGWRVPPPGLTLK